MHLGDTPSSFEASASLRHKDDGYGGSHRLNLPPPELVTAKLPADLVEHGVHHPGLLPVDESIRNVDIFGDDDAARHVLAMLELIGPCPQHRAQDGLDPLQRPALRQR